MSEAEHPKGTPENPLTREDVLRMRDEFVARLEAQQSLSDLSGTSLVLNLSFMIFKEGIELGGEAFAGTIDREEWVATWSTDLRGATFSRVELHWAYRHGIITLREAVLLAMRSGEKGGIGRANLEGAKLAFADLRWASLSEANLQKADLHAADLREANLFSADAGKARFRAAKLQKASLVAARMHEADLSKALLQEADLTVSDLRQANLKGASLQGTIVDGAMLRGAYLWECSWQEAQGLEEVLWGNYVLGEERERDYWRAERLYRDLKAWHTQRGLYDRAGEFFYREMECKRKQARQGKRWGEWLRLGFYRFLFGYGERPWRVASWAAGSIFLLSLVYSLLGGIPFMNALYFSTVSFTAVGYGFSLRETNIPEWAQGVGAAEALWGVLLIALFLTTFVRKMTR